MQESCLLGYPSDPEAIHNHIVLTLEKYFVLNLSKNKIMSSIPASIWLPPHLFTMCGHMEEDLLLEKILPFITLVASTPEV